MALPCRAQRCPRDSEAGKGPFAQAAPHGSGKKTARSREYRSDCPPQSPLGLPQWRRAPAGSPRGSTHHRARFVRLRRPRPRPPRRPKPTVWEPDALRSDFRKKRHQSRQNRPISRSKSLVLQNDCREPHRIKISPTGESNIILFQFAIVLICACGASDSDTPNCLKLIFCGGFAGLSRSPA